jgi:hypothetical protein
MLHFIEAVDHAPGSAKLEASAKGVVSVHWEFLP